MSPRPPALVVLNPGAHGGRAAKRFALVRAVIDANFEARLVTVDPTAAWTAGLRDALRSGVRVFIAAGGDGTAHALLNALLQAPQRPRLEEVTLGAVGLGSSNDLHKPVRRSINGVPVLIDVSRAAPRDVVRCTYVDSAGPHQAFVLVSASLGITAAANARFSERATSARLLRRVSTAAAIGWAAARTLATWHNIPALVRIDGEPEERVPLASLSVLKSEWLSGRLRFGHPIDPASGDFDVALAAGGGRLRLAADILALLGGRFDGRAGHRRLRARSLHVSLETEVPLEMDGEIVTARETGFEVFAERIRLCG